MCIELSNMKVLKCRKETKPAALSSHSTSKSVGVPLEKGGGGGKGEDSFFYSGAEYYRSRGSLRYRFFNRFTG